ncbi:dihydrofolate reductase family protein [Nonomuraea sp. NPDC059194]|uniref:dihydrofolate reductase family protein n=1 Tax=Nonomuraea sp. NPDC059194 TaxID=3346764 RepID=UPI00368BD9F1
MHDLRDVDVAMPRDALVAFTGVHLLDEPASGLHPADTEVLMRQLGVRVDGGGTVAASRVTLDKKNCRWEGEGTTEKHEEQDMRKIVASYFISLDGVVESPDKWHFPYFNDEMGAAIGAQFAESDAMLMGRVLYQEWASYWPAKSDEDDDFAGHINGIQKYVVSNSLDSVDWNNTTLIPGDSFVERLTELKQQPGGTIAMNGSPTLARSLFQHGLIDELFLLVHPIVVGTGQRLFEGSDQIPLKLTSSTTFETGVLSLTYSTEAK